MEEILYKAPALRLDVNQFAKVRSLTQEWKVFSSVWRDGEKESRLPVKILEGAETGYTKTIRTRSDDLIFQTLDIAKKLDLEGVEFWVQKREKLNSKGNPYTFFVASNTTPSPATKP